MYICMYMYIVYHCLLSEIQTKGMSPNSLSVSMMLREEEVEVHDANIHKVLL